MIDEQDKSKSLVKYEPKPLDFAERLEKKKRELQEALERGDVADPITAAIAGITAAQWILAGASLAISILTPVIAGALTPRQKLLEERGRRTGDLVINSELGILIPEVYFGPGDDGYGGSWVPAIVGWTSGIRKHVSTTTSTAGGGKFGGRGATTETREISYDLDWLLIWANKGPYRVLRSKANADVIYDLFGAVSSYEGESASSYTEPYEITAYEHASAGNEVTLQNDAGGNGGIVQWITVQSNGAATRQLSIYYRTSSNTVPIELTINGGTPAAITLPATNEVYLSHTVPVALNDGVNTVKIQNKSTTYNLGVDKIYCFPGHSVTTAGTGILDPTVDPDDPYDPLVPPDPIPEYDRPTIRWNGEPDLEPTGGQTGVMNHGGNAQFAIYPGNTTQLTDPTYEAAIDAQHGAGSTPAYRGRCYEVDSHFFLSRWGGMVPNRTALLEHETIKTKAQFDAFMCSRVGIAAADHDFTGLETIRPRGLRIMGSRFEAREPMQAAEIPYDVVYFERDGVLVGKLKYPFISVATLTDKDFGWNDDEEASDGPLTLIDVIEPDETDLPRRVDVKYVDLDRDGEPGLQGYGRQITAGEDSATLDLQWTLTKEEAQALAQKEVYRRHTEKPCRYFLSWEHLWINVGDVFTATLTDGFTYTILHSKDSGGLGVRQCEGILLDEPLFDQSAVADPHGYEQPIVPLPAMTVMSLLDTPLLRDGDITNNDGVGWYWVATPRTGANQTWHGAILVMFKNGEWQMKADTGLPGTVGTVVSVTSLSTNPTEIDHAGEIVVDLYGTTQTLSSVTEADIEGGANLALAGNMVFNFATATQVGGFPNRWTLTTLLTGQRETNEYTIDVAAGDRFVLINEAVKFVPMEIEDKNVEYDYRAVTAGQSLDDAATIPAVWTGNSRRAHKISNYLVATDGGNDSLVKFRGNPREGEPNTYTIQVWPTTARIDEGTILRTLPVIGQDRPVLLATGALTSQVPGPHGEVVTFVHADRNNLVPAPIDAVGVSFETLDRTNCGFTFGIKHRGADGEWDSGSEVFVGLLPRESLTPISFDFADLPLAVVWGQGYPVDGIGAYTGVPGTVTERWYSYGAEITKSRRLNVDPGYGSIDLGGATADEGRTPQMLTLMMEGADFAGYIDLAGNPGQKAQARIPGPTGGFNLPVRLVASVANSFSGTSVVRSILLHGDVDSGAVYLVEQKEEDVNETELHLRIFQDPNGLPVDIDIS